MYPFPLWGQYPFPIVGPEPAHLFTTCIYLFVYVCIGLIVGVCEHVRSAPTVTVTSKNRYILTWREL